MSDKVTAPKIRAMKKKGEKIVLVTAYDYTSGLIADAAGVDAVLVGDSVGNVMLGYDTTIPVSLQDMVHHTAATARGVRRALVIGDMPFGSYQASPEHAVAAAVHLVKAGAQAVKLEGVYLEAIAAIIKAGIPVMGHLGFTPQSVNQFGGFKVQGRDNGAQIIKDAQQLDKAGVFGIVLELIPSALSVQISQAVSCPTIGIGAGRDCDGQVQVLHDILGLSEHKHKHAKEYCSSRELWLKGIRDYAHEVRNGTFPGPENSF